MAKYKTMDEILALFPKDKPVLINFYDAKTESKSQVSSASWFSVAAFDACCPTNLSSINVGDIKDDIFRAKNLLQDRATLVSIKQQDYADLAKLWDADQKSPSMILFKDGQPITRLYGETHYLEIVAKIGKFCE
jgi:hypothetical protein